ncbi:hypothetical protein [Heyndrickxia sporothermodurans]|uniref:hypothetical protein n=1 Tax=Heyndrickxia sporothermodurans TaxID=46224 RepID=UPI000D34177E|nr:hypothetical protein [Heyndrickxia sporothermodurans]PTY92915.1 hypothetical protein B5V90_02220 [Heyndrickxia sporothermodurans]
MKRMTYTLWDVLRGYISEETCDICNQKYLTTLPNDPAHEPPMSICDPCCENGIGEEEAEKLSA